MPHATNTPTPPQEFEKHCTMLNQNPLLFQPVKSSRKRGKTPATTTPPHITHNKRQHRVDCFFALGKIKQRRDIEDRAMLFQNVRWLMGEVVCGDSGKSTRAPNVH